MFRMRPLTTRYLTRASFCTNVKLLVLGDRFWMVIPWTWTVEETWANPRPEVVEAKWNDDYFLGQLSLVVFFGNHFACGWWVWPMLYHPWATKASPTRSTSGLQHTAMATGLRSYILGISSPWLQSIVTQIALQGPSCLSCTTAQNPMATARSPAVLNAETRAGFMAGSPSAHGDDSNGGIYWIILE